MACSEKGAELISKYKDFSRGALIIMHHQGRWDGQVYPAGLKKHENPCSDRVIVMADSFDARMSDRPQGVIGRSGNPGSAGGAWQSTGSWYCY